MHSSTVFFAAHGLQGLQAARAILVPPIVASDIVTASAIGFRAERLESFFVVVVMVVFSENLI